MPGFFDDLFGGGGDPFGSDFSDIGSIAVDPSTSDFLSTVQPFDMSNLTNTLGDVGQTIGNIGSTFGNFSIPGMSDLGSIDWSSITPALTQEIFGSGGGGSGPLNLAGSIFNNPLTQPLIKQGIGAVLGGAGTTAQPGATGAPSATRTTGTPTGGGILSGLGGGLGGLLSNPAMLGMLPAIYSAITAKDQTNLGPDADALRAQATKNQGLIDSLSQEAQAEKQGQLPGAVMSQLSDSLAAQKAGFATDYSRMGMSGSSAEAADMAALNRKSEQDRASIGLNMASEGLSQVQSLTGQNVGIYQDLMQAQAERDNEYMQAMSGMAEAMGRALGGTTVNVGGGSGAGGVSPDLLQQLQGIIPPGSLPAGATIQDILNQLAGKTSNPINPADLLGVTPATSPLVADPSAGLPGPTLTPNDLITPANPDPNDFIPGPDALVPELGVTSGTI